MENLEELLGATSPSISNRLIGHLSSQKKQIQKSIAINRYLLLEKCQAKTSNGKECSRKCLNIIDKYCQCHIDNPTKYQHIKPKNKNLKETLIDIEKINLNDYLKCHLIQINGNHYLIDQYGTIFDRKDCTIVGYQNNNGNDNIEWF